MREILIIMIANHAREMEIIPVRKFVNVQGGQESIPRNRFRQPI
jgi:hypothetical protein